MVDGGGCKGWTSGRFGDQIVIGVADDFDLGEFSDRQFPADINASVNVRRIGLAAGDQIVAGR